MKQILRHLTSNFFYLLKLPQKREGVIVLTYHRVHEAMPADDLNTPPEIFRRHMRYLKDHCRVIALGELLKEEAWEPLKGTRAQPTVVITFDDGYRDNYLNAYPVLTELGLPAVLFLVTGMIGTDKKRPRYAALPDPDMMDWEEVREMAEGGITFAPHTHTHPRLAQMSYEQQKKEIQDSLETLNAQHFAGFCKSVFCYPYGDYNEDTLAIMAELGFRLAFTVKPGINDAKTPLLELRRTGINGRDTLFDLKKKLAGAFDWLHEQTQRKPLHHLVGGAGGKGKGAG